MKFGKTTREIRDERKKRYDNVGIRNAKKKFAWLPKSMDDGDQEVWLGYYLEWEIYIGRSPEYFGDDYGWDVPGTFFLKRQPV